MAYRKMRTRMKRSTTRRPRRRYRRRRMRMQNKAEVKYFTYTGFDFACDAAYTADEVETLYGEQHQVSSMLSGIENGAERNQRIGNKIFVKFIRFYMFVRGCPDSSNYHVGNFLLRVIVSNTGNIRVAAGTAINGYFSTSEQRNFNGLIDRSAVTVYHDRVYNITSNGYVTTTATPTSMIGGSRRITFTVPINRTVDYITGTNTVRNDRDQLSLITIVGTPGMNAVTNTNQIACYDLNYRVYYTDA